MGLLPGRHYLELHEEIEVPDLSKRCTPRRRAEKEQADDTVLLVEGFDRGNILEDFPHHPRRLWDLDVRRRLRFVEPVVTHPGRSGE